MTAEYKYFMDIGIKILKLRNSKNLSQPELSHRLGISQTALSEIETGKTKKIDFLLVNKICKEFNVDFECFMTDKQNENNFGKAEYSNVGCTNGTINLMSDGILESIIKRLEKLEHQNSTK